jgi:hypothetical protein
MGAKRLEKPLLRCQQKKQRRNRVEAGSEAEGAEILKLC